MGLEQVLQVVIAIIGVVLTGLIIPLIKSKRNVIDLEKTYSIIKILVQSAEQLLHEVDPTGEKRRMFVERGLKRYGIQLSQGELESLRESAVLEVNKALRENNLNFKES